MSQIEKYLSALSHPSPQPIPQILERVPQTRLSLDGAWQFQPAPTREDYGEATINTGSQAANQFRSAPSREDYGESVPVEKPHWPTIHVPGEWFMQGYEIPASQPVLYRKIFELPPEWEPHQVRLRFDSVHSACRVWINGETVGTHEGAFDQFEFDITHALRRGPNVILVEVISDSVSDYMAWASEYAGHPLGGISRKVTIYPVPELHPLRILPVTTLKYQSEEWTLSVDCEWIFEGLGQPADTTVELTLEEPSSNEVIASGRIEVTLREFGQRQSTSAHLAVKNIQSWDCEHPHLYRLILRYSQPDIPLITYQMKIGFREVSVQGNKLIVNGSPVKLRGINRHEAHPTYGRANCAGLARRDVELFRLANINFIRTCHYPPSEEFLDACDELGMFVESEAAICWLSVLRGRRKRLTPELAAPLVKANVANVQINRHHPCILFWSLGNESQWHDNFALAQDAVKALDPTRPTIFHNVKEHGKADILNWHYPEPGEVAGLLADRSQPLLLGEHAHLQTYNRREVAADPGVRDEWGRALESLFATVYQADHLLGMAIWSGIDDVFYPKNQPASGYGPWGIVDGWRREKPEYWHVKKVYSPVRLSLSLTSQPQADGSRTRSLDVSNRYDFTNLSEITIRWRTAGSNWRTLSISLPPRSQMEIELPVTDGCGELEIRAEDHHGALIDEEKITLSKETESTSSLSQRKEIVLHEKLIGNASIKSGDLECGISCESGDFWISKGGRVFLQGLPNLVIAEMEKIAESTTNDYSEAIVPLTGLLPSPRLSSATRISSGSAPGVTLELSWDDGTGEVSLLFHETGHIEVAGNFAFHREIKPRQYGIALSLPEAFDTVAWTRTGTWSSYPDDHIGRTSGKAHAEGKPAQPREKQLHAWSQDGSPLGGNDFRATRTAIHTLASSASDGRTLELDGRSKLAARIWKEKTKTVLLVAEHSSGGSDSFFNPCYASERITLEPNQTFECYFQIKLPPPSMTNTHNLQLFRTFLISSAIVALALCGCDNPTGTGKPVSNKPTDAKNAGNKKPDTMKKPSGVIPISPEKTAPETHVSDGKTGKWGLIKTKEFPTVSLRGYGAVAGTYWVSSNGGAILEIACEDKPKAQLLQAKYLSDVQLLPNVKGTLETNRSQELFAVKAEKQGLIAALRYDNNKVFILSAADQASFDKLLSECVSMNGKNFKSKADVEVPMWLDRWDKFGFRFYYRPGEVPHGKDLTNYDVLQEFDFAQKSDRSGFVFWADQNAMDTAEGQTNDQFWNFGQQAATQRKLPIALNLSLGSGTWLFNRYREQTEQKAPQYCGNYYHGVASHDMCSEGHFSWNSTSGNDAELAVSQKLVREMGKLPNVTTILEPHGELSHDTEIFLEYGPLADASYRKFLEGKYKTFSALQKAWDVPVTSWDKIRVPEVASFLGWQGDAIDLKGEWKVGYEKFANGKTYSEHELRFGMGNQIVPTDPAPADWTAERFNDSSWPTVVAPGHDRTMFLPQRPAVYRRTFNLPQEWLAKHPKSWIYIWDLNSGTGNKVKVFLNGKQLGESSIVHATVHWCVMDTAGMLKAGANQVSLCLPKGILGYRVYISADEPKQYPNLGEGKNNQWVDFCSWSVNSMVAMVRRGAEMIRQVDPNRQIDFMSPGYYVDGVKQIAKTYGGNVKNTGYMAAFWADDLPAYMRGAGLPFSTEPGGSASDFAEFKKFMGLWQTEAVQGVDYFIHVGAIFWNPEIRKNFEETLPLIKLIGKYHAPKAELATLNSTASVKLTGFPWGKNLNTNLSSGYWSWNVRGYLMGLYESDMLTESSFASGDAARYKVIIDSNSSIMDEAMVSQIESYVRAGGTFITFVQTGRHSPSKKDSWPISRLTGYQVTKIDQLDPRGRPAETRMLVPAAGQEVFSGEWKVPANGLSLKKASDEAKDLLMWNDGSTAVGVRPLGKGYIYQVGCKFTGKSISDRMEGAPNKEDAALIQLFSQLLTACKIVKIEATLVPNDYKVMLRHYVSNNGLYDVWMLWNRDSKSAASTELVLPKTVSSSWAWNVQSKKQIPIANGKIAVQLEPLDYQVLLTPRNEIAQAPCDWFELQRSWWQGTTRPPALKEPPVLNKCSMDLAADWAFKPLAPDEKVTPELLKSDAAGLEKICMGIWSATHPTVKHALLTKTFTVPQAWADGKVGLWLKLWWGKTFYDNGRIWLDGKLVKEASAEGITDINPDNVLQPGTTHTLSVEIDGKGSLVGSRAAAWLWVWPKPLQVLDLAGAWAQSTDLLSYTTPVTLPGKYAAKSFRRTITVPAAMAGNNAVLDVDAEGGLGVYGVIINGYFIKHDISDLHFQINMTPWIRFGKENEIELVNFASSPVNIKHVSIGFHIKGIYP